MDAAGSERAALFGVSEGGPMSVLFAATHPERVSALVLLRRDGAHHRGARLPVGDAGRGAAGVRRRVIAPYCGQRPRRCSSCSRRASPAIRRRSSTSAASALGGEPGDAPADLRDVPRHRRARRAADDRTSRRSSCTGAATGWSIAAPARTSPRRSPARSTSSCRASTTCPGPATMTAMLGEIEEFLTGARTAPRARARAGDRDVHRHRRLDRARLGAGRQALARPARRPPRVRPVASSSGSAAAR